MAKARQIPAEVATLDTEGHPWIARWASQAGNVEITARAWAVNEVEAMEMVENTTD